MERLLLSALLAGIAGFWLADSLAEVRHGRALQAAKDLAEREKDKADKRADDAAAALERYRKQRAPLIAASQDQGRHALNAAREWADTPLPVGLRDAAAAVVAATRDAGEPARAMPSAAGASASDE